MLTKVGPEPRPRGWKAGRETMKPEFLSSRFSISNYVMAIICFRLCLRGIEAAFRQLTDLTADSFIASNAWCAGVAIDEIRALGVVETRLAGTFVNIYGVHKRGRRRL